MNSKCSAYAVPYVVAFDQISIECRFVNISCYVLALRYFMGYRWVSICEHPLIVAVQKYCRESLDVNRSFATVRCRHERECDPSVSWEVYRRHVLPYF